MRRRICGLMLLFVCLFLCGCEYSHEITDMAYAVAVGVDEGASGYRISFQFARPLSIGGQSEAAGASGKEEEDTAAKNKNTTLLSIDAEDFYTALSVAENSLSKSINLSHTKLLLFSKEIASHGLTDLVTLFMRNSQFSPNTYAAISLCRAEEYMKTVKPSLEINPAKYYTLIFSKNNSDFLPETTLRDLYFDLAAPGKEPVLPVANLVGEEEDGEEKEQSAQGEYEAGMQDERGENRTDVAGMAVISKGKLSGVMSTKDAVSYHILLGELEEYYLTFSSVSKKDRHITLRLTQDKAPKHNIALSDEGIEVFSALSLNAEVVECPDEDAESLGSEGVAETAREKLENQLEGFLKKTRDVTKADVVGYGRIAKMQFLDYPTWERYGWPEKYQKAGFSVLVNITVSREGLVQAE